jgi:hypothetical protein
MRLLNYITKGFNSKCCCAGSGVYVLISNRVENGAAPITSIWDTRLKA